MNQAEFKTALDKFVMNYRKEQLENEFRLDEEPDWITVNGNHIPIDPDTKEPIGGQMKAIGGGKKYGGLSEESTQIIEEHKKNPYHFGDSNETKTARRQKLIRELLKSGVGVHKNEEYDSYSVLSPDMSWQENKEVTNALNQSYYSVNEYDRSDYIKKCEAEGKTPRLHFEPEELPEEFFYSKSGKLQHDGTPVYKMLDSSEVLSDSELLKYNGYDLDLNEKSKVDADKAFEKAAEGMTDAQRTAVYNYTKQFSGTNYQAINQYLVTGNGDERVQEAAKNITEALDNEIGADCICARGDDTVFGIENRDKVDKLLAQIEKGNFSNAEKLKKLLEGKSVTNDAVMSTSPGASLEGFDRRRVQYIFKTPKNAKAVNITKLSAFGGARSETEKALANTGLFGAVSNESEVAFKPKTRYSIDKVMFSVTPEKKKNRGQVFLVCSILPDEARTDEDEWITINGTHVLIDDETKEIKQGPDRLKELNKKKEDKPTLRSELTPRRTDYDFTLDDDQDEFIHKNFGNRKNPGKLYNFFHEVEDKGGDGPLAVEDEYYKLRLSKCTEGLHEITRDEADEILYDNLRHSTVSAWFREYNHGVKPALIWQLTQSPEVHNAALNIMYQNYKYNCQEEQTEPLSFDKFLVTPIKIYRGGSGKEYKEASPFSSYTFSKKVAESFTGSEVGQGHAYDPNGVVYEAEIRPIDTYGSVYTNGESEILVPRTIAPNGNRDSADDISRIDQIRNTVAEIKNKYENRYFSEKFLDNRSACAKIKSKENNDGAPEGNQNAAGPHKKRNSGRVIGKRERAKLESRFVGKKTSQGTTITRFSEHAFKRLGGRLMSAGRIQNMIDSKDVKPDKIYPDRKLYNIEGSRMVIGDDGVIISIMWRKQNRNGRSASEGNAPSNEETT